MLTERKTLTMTQFLRFLHTHCVNEGTLTCNSMQKDIQKSLAYNEIRGLIETFLKDYAEQKALTKNAQEEFLIAIETDQRRQFDGPIELISHIHEIASRPPFFDSERISLASIDAFCMDFMHRHKIEIRKELIATASF